MGGMPEFVEFCGQKTGRLPEKNSFSQKCSLLSQYLKEKGSFGDLSLGITCNNNNNNAVDAINIIGNGSGASDMFKQRTTMNLFPMSDKQVDVFNSTPLPTTRTNNVRSMDLFPQQSGFVTTTPREDLQKRVDSSVNKPVSPESPHQNAQLTIFYGGQVIVFNDFPADKAKEVMLLASTSNSNNNSNSNNSLVGSPPPPVFAPNNNVAKSPPPVESNTSLPSTSTVVPNFANNLIRERLQPPPQTIARELPIARRASLHRFLEKRRERITATAPYQTSDFPGIPSKPVAESKSWLGLAAAQSSQ